jgi:hypothetical protein
MWTIALALSLAIGSITPKPAPSDFPRGVFVGRIGASQVVLEIGNATNTDRRRGVDRFGQYFYRTYGIGIPLDIVRNANGSFGLSEVGRGTEDFAMKRTGDTWLVRVRRNRLVGTWTSANGRRSEPIALTFIGASTPRRFDDGSDSNDPRYEKELTSEPTRLGAIRHTASGAAYRTLTDTRFGISGIRIVSLANERVRERANDVLTADFDAHRIYAAACLEDASFVRGGGRLRQTLRVAVFTRRVVSVDERFLSICGEIPSEWFAPLTIDLRNGQEVDFKVAIANPTRIVERYPRAAIDVIRSAGYLPCIADVYKRSDFRTLVDGFAYEFVPGGLLMRAEFPHVAAGCAADVVVPPTEARSALLPEYRDLVP